MSAGQGGRDGRAPRDRWGGLDGEEHARGEPLHRRRGPSPGTITSTSLIGNPDPPRWYRPPPGSEHDMEQHMAYVELAWEVAIKEKRPLDLALVFDQHAKK